MASTTMTSVRPRRDKHPARSARILSTGLAVMGTLGISSALTVSAQAAQQSTSLDPQLGVVDTASQQVSAQVAAPTVPGSATPAHTPLAPTNTAQSSPIATAPAVPQVINVPIPVAPQVAWTPPATSGSK